MTAHRKTAPWIITFGLMLAAGLVAASLPAAPVRAAAEQENELHEAMEEIGEIMSKLRRSVRKPEENAESLKLVLRMQELTLKAMGLVPESVAALPADKKAADLLIYKRKMAATYVSELDLEQAVRAGDTDKAYEHYKALAVHKSEGHEQFQIDD